MQLTCIRPIGHRGRCQPTIGADVICGVWLRHAKDVCARRPGHATNAAGGAHRSRYAMNNRIATLRARCGREVRLGPVLAPVVVLGPVPCKGCGWLVTWNGFEWQQTGLQGTAGQVGNRHACKRAA